MKRPVFAPAHAYAGVTHTKFNFNPLLELESIRYAIQSATDGSAPAPARWTEGRSAHRAGLALAARYTSRSQKPGIAEIGIAHATVLARQGSTVLKHMT
jgi:hypothetical protein